MISLQAWLFYKDYLFYKFDLFADLLIDRLIDWFV